MDNTAQLRRGPQHRHQRSHQRRFVGHIGNHGCDNRAGLTKSGEVFGDARFGRAAPE